MPPRFLCPPLDPQTPVPVPVELDADESHHALRVLRLAPGDAVELFDGAGQTAPAVIVGQSGGRVTCQRQSVTVAPRPQPHLTVAVALPKGSRAEDLANQLAQLGVDVLVPLNCEFGVVKIKPNKLERLERASLAAAKQCGRPHLMQIADPLNLAQAAEQAAAADHARLLEPDATPWTPAALAADLANARSVWLLIGPEGGFSDTERATARDHGAAGWRLNPHVLRIETAAAAAAAVVRHAGPG